MVKVAKAYLSDPFYEAPSFEAFTWFQRALKRKSEAILGLGGLLP